MRKFITIIAVSLLSITAMAQQKVRVHNSGNTMYATGISTVDSIKLDASYARIKVSGNASLDIQKVYIDSLTFTPDNVVLDKIYIIYNGTDNATIINPYAGAGIAITANGGTVNVTAASGIDNLEYNILGSSANGSLTMATDKAVNLVLQNLTLTNPLGAAFLISGGKATNLILKAGTTNSVSDGSGSAKNATLQTDGPVVVSGSGTLNVAGVKKHGITTMSSITVQSGTVNISAAASDGLHSEGYNMSGGTVNITSLSDGIDAGDGNIAISSGTINVTCTAADVKAIRTSLGTITITGGTISLAVSGAQSKGLSAKGNISFGGGTTNVALSGAAVLTASGSGYNPSYATGIKTDGQVIINSGTINIQAAATATGGKGISAAGGITINDGTITISTAGNGAVYTNSTGVSDSYSSAALSSDANIVIAGGTLTFGNSGSGGKNISANGAITISGGTLSLTDSGSEGKAIKADGIVTFAGGNTTIALSGDVVLTASGTGYNASYTAGVKSATQVVVNNGTLAIQATSAAKGARGLSSDGTIAVNGGNITVSIAGSGAVYTNATGVTDSYSAAAFSADTGIAINGGTVTTTCSGTGGKGLKSDGTITIGTAAGNPTVAITTTGARFLVSGTDYNHPKTIVAGGAVTISNGTNTINSTDDGVHSDVSVTVNGGNTIVNAVSATTGVGEGVEAPLIVFNGGVTNVTASNDGLNATYGTVTGGTESNDNSNINITGGIVIVAGSDAIDSNGNVTITGGTTIVCGPTSQPEEGLDYNGTFLMNGGLVISAGSNSGMTKNFSTNSTQVSMYLKSSSQLAANSVLHIEKSDGTEMVTFKPKNSTYYFHFSSPALATGTSYKVYFGGSYTGGSFVGNSTGWGLYTGGSYSSTGGTLKKTFTSSTTSKLNVQTF